MFNNIINMLKTIIVSLFTKRNINNQTWIFSSSLNEKFNYNSKYLFEYVIEQHEEIKPVFIINDDKYRKKLQTKYGKEYFIEAKSLKGIKTVLDSGVWFTSAGLPIYGFNLNKNHLIINLWHGVPLKKIALEEEGISRLTKLYFKYIFSANYDYILTTSKKLIPIMSASFGVSENRIKVWGQPRNDLILKKNDKKKILKKLYDTLPTYKKIILYAPTFREFGKTKLFPFTDYNEKKLNDFLEKNQLIIFIRMHQSEVGTYNFEYSNRVIFLNDDKVEDITEVLNIFDLLITDYSSIYIDYLLTKKPLLFLPYDQADYLNKRGLNFKFEKVTPGPKPTTFKEFKREIKLLLEDKEYYKNERKKNNLEFNEFNDISSEYIVKKIKNKLKDAEND